MSRRVIVKAMLSAKRVVTCRDCHSRVASEDRTDSPLSHFYHPTTLMASYDDWNKVDEDENDDRTLVSIPEPEPKVSIFRAKRQ